MGRRSLNVFILAVIILAAGILTYPQARFWYSDYQNSSLIVAYLEGNSARDAIKTQQQWQEARDYNESLGAGQVSDPFAYQRTGEDPVYENLLNPLKDGMMGYISIPSIGIDVPIFHGITQDSLAKGVGHLKGSALPVGSDKVQCILAGHNAMTTTRIFTDLHKLKQGDVFSLHILTHILSYRVVQSEVVTPEHTEALTSNVGSDRVTLITCTPYGVNSHRLLIRGERIAENLVKSEKTHGKLPLTRDLVMFGVGLLLLSSLLLWLLLALKEKRRTSTPQLFNNLA